MSSADLTDNNAKDLAFSSLMINLLKGILYRDEHENRWQDLLNFQVQVREYIAILGLELKLYEDAGFAWLATIDAQQQEDDAKMLPRLTTRRPLSYPLSLLLVVLRKRLLEFDSLSSEEFLVIEFTEIAELIQPYLPTGSNEAKLRDTLQTQIKKAVEMGFLKPLKAKSTLSALADNLPEAYQVRQILSFFVDAEWIDSFEKRLDDYQQYSMQTKGSV